MKYDSHFHYLKHQFPEKAYFELTETFINSSNTTEFGLPIIEWLITNVGSKTNIPIYLPATRHIWGKGWKCQLELGFKDSNPKGASLWYFVIEFDDPAMRTAFSLVWE